jgi:Ca2+-binding EF-hand superfamily protein
MPPTGTAPVTVTSHAPDSVSSNYHVDFAAIDKNGDGSLSRSEVSASGNEDLVREFHVVDANHNGRLSKDEMKGWTD